MKSLVKVILLPGIVLFMALPGSAAPDSLNLAKTATLASKADKKKC